MTDSGLGTLLNQATAGQEVLQQARQSPCPGDHSTVLLPGLPVMPLSSWMAPPQLGGHSLCGSHWGVRAEPFHFFRGSVIGWKGQEQAEDTHSFMTVATITWQHCSPKALYKFSPLAETSKCVIFNRLSSTWSINIFFKHLPIELVHNSCCRQAMQAPWLSYSSFRHSLPCLRWQCYRKNGCVP